MGLSASQARFLGITLRKANCEFKSTELAQQRLELTNQMTDISQEYANALNSTKLVWHNEGVCDSFGNPTDFGLSYSLLMMPSAANDYNPYMVSTRTGAIILNSKYADAAKAAGISMAGGVPSQAGRDEFLKSLAVATTDPVTGRKYDSVITQTTCDILTGTATVSGKKVASGDVSWHYSAGMGALPKEKGVTDVTHLDDLQLDSNIGGRSLDWLQIERGLLDLGINEGMTDAQYKEVMKGYTEDVAQAKLDYINNKDGITMDSETVNNLVKLAAPQAENLINQWKSIDAGSDESEVKIAAMKAYSSNDANAVGSSTEEKEAFIVMGKFAYLEAQISKAQNEAQRIQYMNELEKVKMGYDETSTTTPLPLTSPDAAYRNPLYWAVYEQTKASLANSSNSIAWSDSTGAGGANHTANFDDLFQTVEQKIASGTYTTGGVSIDKLTVVVNDVICKDKNELKSMTISDLLSQNIVLMAKGGNSADSISKAAGYLMEYIASVFGYGHIGTGLNVDPEADSALNMAMASVKKLVLKSANAIKNGGDSSDSSMLSNSAYVNANKFNRIGSTENGEYSAINLSNMLSAFLTYFDNYLRGSDSDYVVSRGNTDDKTSFVTDDPAYVYVTNSKDEITNDEKIADFFNELYNNICEHGWRQDDMVLDNEYLESAVKDGRYQLMALNNDGYFYQMRYNEVGYMEEVQDTDAIAKAESDYKVKKAQITFKEDEIDVKTKKLDAEITELNTEINSVQNIISKAIEKTFTMFSN